MSLLLGIFTFVLILVSLFMMLVILMQRSKTDGGLGASLGGGMAESTFGAETNTVLFNATRNAAIAFFVLSFGLYLGHLWVRNHSEAAASGLPEATPAFAPAGEETSLDLEAPVIEFPAIDEPEGQAAGGEDTAGSETSTTATETP